MVANIGKIANKVGGSGSKAPVVVDDVVDSIPASVRNMFIQKQVNPDFIDKAEETVAKGAGIAVGSAESLTNNIGMAGFGIPMILGAFASAMAWLGEKTNLKPLMNASSKANAGGKALSETLLKDSWFAKNRVTSAVGKGFSGASTGAGKALSKAGLESAGKAMSSLPSTLATTSTATSLVNGAFIAGSAVQMAGAGVGFFSGITELKRLTSEMTGENASTFKVLFGNVPEVVKAERGTLLKNLFVSEAVGGLSLGFFVKQAVRVISMPVMLAFTAVQMGAGMVTGGGSLSTYSALRKAHESGMPLGASDYTALIGVASPEIVKRGGAESAFAVALGEQYAKEQTSPAMVMQEIEQGLDKVRIQTIITANEAKKVAPQVAEPVMAKAAAPQVASNTQQQTAKPIVGKFTAENARRQSAPIVTRNAIA